MSNADALLKIAREAEASPLARLLAQMNDDAAEMRARAQDRTQDILRALRQDQLDRAEAGRPIVIVNIYPPAA